MSRLASALQRSTLCSALLAPLRTKAALAPASLLARQQQQPAHRAPFALARAAARPPRTFPALPAAHRGLSSIAIPDQAIDEEEEFATEEDEDRQKEPLDLVGQHVPVIPKRKRGKDWVAQLHVRSFDPNALDYACQYIQHLADALGVRTGSVIPLPKHKRSFTVLRSPHVHKKARDQFKLQTHKRLICLYDTAPEAVDGFVKELGDKAPISVQIKCKRQLHLPTPAPVP